jgi:hypothetical protein
MPRTIEDQFERAHTRWAKAERASSRTQALWHGSVWRLAASRLVLDFPRLRPISGGADSTDGALSADAVRTRIRALLGDGAQPSTKLYAGPSRDGRTRGHAL